MEGHLLDLDGKEAAVAIIDDMLQKGSIKKSTKPKDAFIKHPGFQKNFTLDQFRSRYNTQKKTFFNSIDSARAQLGTKSTVVDAILGASSKTRRVDNDSEEEEVEVGEGDGEKLLSGERHFKPLFNVWQREEPRSLDVMISVVFVLPSGVRNFMVSVEDGGDYLSIDVEWPPVLSDMKLLHSKWLKGVESPGGSSQTSVIEMYHPRIVTALKSLKRKRARVTDKIRSVARIPLPQTVSAEIAAEHNMEFEASPGARVIYIDLKTAKATAYNREHKSGNFEKF